MVRLSPNEKALVLQAAAIEGFRHHSTWLRRAGLRAAARVLAKKVA
jgi:uncharacterized protein (DUF1778 family)